MNIIEFIVALLIAMAMGGTIALAAFTLLIAWTDRETEKELGE